MNISREDFENEKMDYLDEDYEREFEFQDRPFTASELEQLKALLAEDAKKAGK